MPVPNGVDEERIHSGRDRVARLTAATWQGPYGEAVREPRSTSWSNVPRPG